MSTVDLVFYLNIRCADQPEVRCLLDPGHLLVGRDPAAGLQLHHYSVSRRHCLLYVAPDQVTLEDSDSSNGTYLNGRLLRPHQPVRLTADDEVQIGPFRLRLQATTRDHLASLPPAGLAEQRLGLGVTSAEGSYAVPLDGPTVAGSDASCGVCVRQPGVAPRHAYLEPRGDALSIEAIGDAVLWKDGQRVRSATLRRGEQAGLGDQVILTARSCYVLHAKPPEPLPLDLDLMNKSEILMGRAPECNVRLDHPLVSRHHVRLRRRHAGWVVEDLGSVQGAFVDGARLRAPVMIREGQTLELAGFKFAIARSALRQFPSAGVRRIDAIHLEQRVRNGKTILRDISLHMESGELIALVGGSGAGKTTLLNALSGFAPASQGHVLFDGRDLYERYDLFRAQIGYVPQQDVLHESLPLERALLYSSQLRLSDHGGGPSRRQWIHSILAQLGLAGLRDHAIATLSGGERKRANMAAELITAPSVLFLDEPTSGLDPVSEEALMIQLRELADSGKIVVVVTHVTQNLALCDKVAFIGQGGYLAYLGVPEDALDYFEVKTFTQIYKRLTVEQTPAWWAQRYQTSTAYARYIGEPQARIIEQGLSTTRRRLIARRPSRLRQLAVLTGRYIELVARDWLNLLLMLLQAPLIAMLMGAGLGQNAFDAQKQPTTTLFFMAVVAVWFGIFDSTREIVKEQAVYRRERMATIDVSPYLLSKVIVLAAIGLFQVGAFLATASWLIDFPVPTYWTYLYLLGILMMGTLLGVEMGLCASALVNNPDRANTAIVFLLVPQLILAGAFMPVSKMPSAIKVLSMFAASRWTFEALGAQIEILSILQKGGRLTSFAETFDVDVTRHVAVMAASLLLLLIGCYVALRRKDRL